MYKTLHKKQGSVTVQLRFARSSVTFCAKRDSEETIMDNIIMLGEHGITVETANDDMAGYYQKMEQAGKRKITVLFHLLILWQYFSDVSEPTDRRFYE